jgi:putative ABC transport system permease protein
MFFVRYLRRELRSRMRQALVIALGLAVGVGLVVTVIAASAGVTKAQSGVLKGLYGVGTDVTVTAKPPPFNPNGPGSAKITIGPGGGQVCNGSKCSTGGQSIDNLTSPAYGPIGYSEVASVARLRGVAAAAGGLSLSDLQVTIPASVLSGEGGGGLPSPKSFAVTGVDFAHPSLGPLSDGTIISGRGFRASDASADVAIADSGYAVSNNLKTGSAVTIAKTKFTVIGIVSQPQGSNPPDLYIPLARAQALGTSSGKRLKGDVNTIYVTAASAAGIPAVQKEISRLLPSDTVTTPSSLASQVSGSLSSTAKLASDLGRWLAILVLIAAFTVAALLTTAAVSRRVREFGTLKALGWRSRRIISQVMGESVVTGVLGAALGTGLGFAGAAIIDAIAPKLSASLTTATGQHFATFTGAGSQTSSPTVTHTVAVPMSASVSGGAIGLAVVLAIAGGVLAGIVASWRIGSLRPADALARVA